MNTIVHQSHHQSHFAGSCPHLSVDRYHDKPITTHSYEQEYDKLMKSISPLISAALAPRHQVRPPWTCTPDHPARASPARAPLGLHDLRS